MNDGIMRLYRRWLERAVADAEVAEELRAMAQEESRIEDAFYRSLAFGTGGLRGMIGAGTNRMNIYTVARASQGLADDVVKRFAGPARRIAVSYDSRIKSKRFAEVAAGVFAASGIQVYVFSELMPTPCLSYAVRALGCSAGVMITASHNPARYNGYKVYGADGCQITTEAAARILDEIEKLDAFDDVRQLSFEEGLRTGRIAYIPEEVTTGFVEAVKRQSVLPADAPIDRSIPIVYSPLNGTGLKPVLRTLREAGYSNITVVAEQAQPDGHFPTCPYPNPEEEAALAMSISYAQRFNADLALATDPDCDRVGVAVRNAAGGYVPLSGNEVGLLLLDYICAARTAAGTMPGDPVLVKTIVTTDMAERIAARYGVRTVNVLTGFKFIGEQIGLLEAEGKADSYVFGFEESYGYLSGAYVRDKDAVGGVFLICEMFAYYRSQGVHLLEKLHALYAAYGYCLNTQHSYELDGAAGFARMQRIMRRFRGEVAALGGRAVLRRLDYGEGLDGLPKAEVLKFLLAENCSVVVRPSGTEPKLKLYISVSAECVHAARAVEAAVVKDCEALLGE